MKIVVINNYKELEKTEQVLRNLKRCTEEPLEMLDYKNPNLHEKVIEKGPELLVLTGSNFMLSKADTRRVFQNEMDLVRKLDVPILGICFGHQLIGNAYGSEVADLDESVREIKKVNILERHPVFEGLPDTIEVSESHRQALTSVPKGFRHLAESTTSKVEAICHETRPIYSFQFHPERSNEKFPHGRMIIQNVLRLAVKA